MSRYQCRVCGNYANARTLQEAKLKLKPCCRAYEVDHETEPRLDMDPNGGDYVVEPLEAFNASA